MLILKSIKCDNFISIVFLKVPRIVLLVNDAKSNPSQDLSKIAFDLSRLDIIVIAIGIGSNIDEDELSTIVSKRENLFLFESYEQVFERLNDVKFAVCSAQVSVHDPEEETYTQLGTDDVRYFKINVKKFRGELATLKIDTIRGDVSTYYSFSDENPTKSQTEFNAKEGLNHKFLFVPSNAEYLYITIMTKTVKSEITISLEEF